MGRWVPCADGRSGVDAPNLMKAYGRLADSTSSRYLFMNSLRSSSR